MPPTIKQPTQNRKLAPKRNLAKRPKAAPTPTLQERMDEEILWGEPEPPELEDPHEDPLPREIQRFVSQFVTMPEPAQTVVVLWIMQTHVFQEWRWASYLNITSPVRGSGKSTLAGVLSHLCWNATRPTQGTLAAIRHEVAKSPITLILDEWDSMPASRRKDFAQFLNLGTQAGAVWRRMEGGKPREYPAFGPKVIGGISRDGVLSESTMSRCFPILLQRGEPQSEFGEGAKQRTERLRESLAAWAESFCRREKVEPTFPPELRRGTFGRERQNARPLLEIAEYCDESSIGRWSLRARRAVVELLLNQPYEPEPRIELIRLLKDYLANPMHGITSKSQQYHGQKVFQGSRFCDWFNRQPEHPWPERQLTESRLANELRPFGIAPDRWREPVYAGGLMRGYAESMFRDAFARYP